MANGNTTHDESDGSGRTGIGVAGGEGGHMEGGADVEVQDNELVMVLFWSIKNIKRKRSLLVEKLFWKIISKILCLIKKKPKFNKEKQNFRKP
jgi:hypothetical protein